MIIDMGMTCPGKDKVYAVAYVYCYSFFPHFSHLTPYPKVECELHKGMVFCLFG